MKGKGAAVGQEHGFTLIEVMIAVAISAMVMTAVYAVFFQVEKTGRIADAEDLKARQLRLAADIIGADLRGAFVRQDRDGVYGLRANPSGATAPLMSLWTRSARNLSGNGDAAHVEYRLILSQGDGLWVLNREELRGDGVVRLPLIAGLMDVSLRFYLQDRWQNEWRGAGNLPVAVEMTLVRDGKFGEVAEDRLTLTFPICSQG